MTNPVTQYDDGDHRYYRQQNSLPEFDRIHRTVGLQDFVEQEESGLPAIQVHSLVAR